MDSTSPQQPPPAAGQAAPPPPGTQVPPGAFYPPPQKDNTGRTVLLIVGSACGCIALMAFVGTAASMVIGLWFGLGFADPEHREQARDAVRMVIAAEAAYYAANSCYATLSELHASGHLNERYASDPARIGDGITVTLTLAPDRASFEVKAAGESVTYIGDESGVISEL